MWHRYRLLTRWRIAAPAAPVWQALLHSERWPRWWPALEDVQELAPGDDGGIGNRRRYTWRTPFGYRLHFVLHTTRIEPGQLLEGEASGDALGWGRWYLARASAGTDAVYEWDVEIARPSMRVLSALAHPLFAWSHQHLMRQGARGLARALGCRVECQALAPDAPLPRAGARQHQ